MFGIGIGIGVSRDLNSGGGGGDLPSTWDPLEYWDGDEGITIGTGVSAWAGRVVETGFLQSGSTLQPAYDATDSDFNGRGTLEFDGSNDLMGVDIADLSLLNQRFFHDDTSDWEILMAFLIPVASTGGFVISTGVGGIGTGFQIEYSTSATRLSCAIISGTVKIANLNTTVGSLVPGTAQLLRITYTKSSRNFAVTTDASSSNTTAAGSVDTGDANGTLGIGGSTSFNLPVPVKIGSIFISKIRAATVPGREAEQATYHNDRYGTNA